MAVIYRASHFSSKTTWNFPLKAVEFYVEGDNFRCLIYDVGHEPPYFDVSQLPMFHFGDEAYELKEPILLKQLIPLAESKGIFAEEWNLVQYPLAHLNSAMICPDTRPEIEDVFGYREELPKPIARETAAEGLEYLSGFEGHSARVLVQFLERTIDYENHPYAIVSPTVQPYQANGAPSAMSKLTLRTFAGHFALISRRPDQYPSWGLVGKGGLDGVSFLVSAEEDMKFVLYDQAARQIMIEGAVIKMKVACTSTSECFELNSEGIFPLY